MQAQPALPPWQTIERIQDWMLDKLGAAGHIDKDASGRFVGLRFDARDLVHIERRFIAEDRVRIRYAHRPPAPSFIHPIPPPQCLC
jgi:hypothetical protein